uniref:Uncharacterized protein n=1 Tax=Oryza sativa subsp. japonica TaxID=39947 RepID=Q6YSZ4_ORYSJ|nr:hypothetical protein [Oryza sativa Japonica Group]BAC84746.1 hypothetical protein [Oryza sativa Japonica Group]
MHTIVVVIIEVRGVGLTGIQRGSHAGVDPTKSRDTRSELLLGGSDGFPTVKGKKKKEKGN